MACLANRNLRKADQGQKFLFDEVGFALLSTSSMELPTLSSEPIELTPLGNTWVDSDRALRRRAARGALLTWLGEQGATKQNPIDVTDFPAVKRAVGRAFLSQADLTDASDFLVSEGLIERVADPPDGVPEKAWPTSKGVHCIEEGGNVSDYIERDGGRLSYNFYGPVSGANLAFGNRGQRYLTPTERASRLLSKDCAEPWNLRRNPRWPQS